MFCGNKDVANRVIKDIKLLDLIANLLKLPKEMNIDFI